MTPAEIRRARTSHRYRAMRRAFLRANPLCRPCRERGHTAAAVEIDHIEPVTKAPERFWDETDWQPICRSCHEGKSARELRRLRGATVEGELA